MSRLALKACVLLAVTLHAEGQYADFLQSFNAFLQPFTTTRPRHEVTKRPETKHRQTNKHKYDDVIFFPTDDKDLYSHVNHGSARSTTPKKSTKSSHNDHTTPRPKPKPLNSKIINNSNSHVTRSVGNNNEQSYNNIDHNSHNLNSEATTSNKANNKQVINHRPQTQHQSFQDNNRGIHGTTLNPLLNRPGVKPAVVDENKPPITNRPVTQRQVYDLPFEQYRPANTRPPYEIERPKPGHIDANFYDKRPTNTRPPFETERPVTSRPVLSKPVTSSNLPSDQDEPDIEIGPDEDDMSEVEKRRYYETCEQKCTEYKSAHTRKVVALPLAGSPQRAEVNVTSCSRTNVPLIIGGEVADIRGFPHMALVGWLKLQGPGYSWKCGGSLVSEQYILTAGHCTYYDKDDKIVSGPPHAVQLGSSKMDGWDSTVVQVSTIIRHPKYKLRRSYYDVAIIRLKHTVTFSEKIRPACLGVPPRVGEPIVATGWGKTEFGGDSSIELRSVSLPIWDMTECREIWGTSRKLPQGPMADNQLCAGERKGAKDTCQGDSGGPAQIQDGCSWRIVAVTSLGRSCGAPETPALYAKIPRAFIASQVYTNVKTNNNWGSGNNNAGITNNNAGITNNNAGIPNNNRAVENAWGSINNNRRNENNNGGIANNWESTSSGIRNNNHGSSNTNSGIANNNWESSSSGIRNNNRDSGNNNGGITNNNGGSANNNQGNRNVANTKPIENNGQSSNQRTERRNDGSNNFNTNNQNNDYNLNSRNEYNNPISYGQNYNEQNNRNTNVGSQNYYNKDRPSDFNKNNDNYYNNNNYAVNPPWWTR